MHDTTSRGRPEGFGLLERLPGRDVTRQRVVTRLQVGDEVEEVGVAGEDRVRRDAVGELGEVPAETAFCFATGNTARMRALDCGIIEVGRSADFVIMDRAQHSAGKNILESVRLGDLPGIGMTIIDGIVRTQRSRNTPPATKVPSIV